MKSLKLVLLSAFCLVFLAGCSAESINGVVNPILESLGFEGIDVSDEDLENIGSLIDSSKDSLSELGNGIKDALKVSPVPETRKSAIKDMESVVTGIVVLDYLANASVDNMTVIVHTKAMDTLDAVCYGRLLTTDRCTPAGEINIPELKEKYGVENYFINLLTACGITEHSSFLYKYMVYQWYSEDTTKCNSDISDSVESDSNLYISTTSNFTTYKLVDDKGDYVGIVFYEY